YQVLHARFSELRNGKSIAALFRDNSDTVTYLSKYMLSELNAINSIESITGVNYDQLRVLLLLFAYRDTMVSMLTIMFSLHDGAKSTKVQKACKVLCDMGYIAREPGASKSGVTKKNYMILEEGMDVVLKYLDYVKTHGINELNRK
ncbi:MAG TPA: hypothetical protein VL943_15350, partial [Niabella sp.]|nr:hypothetical protein [Niabella sp.]